MGWRLIQVQEADMVETDLTGSELFGVSVSLANTARKITYNEDNVYARAWKKIQPAADLAREED